MTTFTPVIAVDGRRCFPLGFRSAIASGATAYLCRLPAVRQAVTNRMDKAPAAPPQFELYVNLAETTAAKRACLSTDYRRVSSHTDCAITAVVEIDGLMT